LPIPGKGIFHKQPRSGLEVGDKDLYLIKNGDFIIQVTFAWEGAVGLASQAEDGMYGSVRFPTFRVDESKCYPSYLLNYFRTKEGRDQLVKICPGSAGRNRVLSLKRIPEVLVPLPPLAEQQRIVARVQQLAEKITQAQELRRSAVVEAQALLDAEFETLVSQHSNDDSWTHEVLTFFADLNPHRTFIVEQSPDTPIPFIPMAAVDDNTGTIIRVEAKPLMDTGGYTWFESGDVIFAKITPCMENGKSALVPELDSQLRRGCGSTEFHVLRPRAAKIIAEYLHKVVRNKSFRADAATHFKGSAGQQRVPQSFLKQKVIHAPTDLQEQRRIVVYLDSLQVQVERLRQLQAATATELDVLLPSVLDRAFRGEL